MGQKTTRSLLWKWFDMKYIIWIYKIWYIQTLKYDLEECCGCIFRRNATHCISPYAIVMCVCLSVCLCVYAAFVDARKTVWDRYVNFFYKLRGMLPYITCKIFTQIGLQIRRWRTKWRPWNTIIGRNSAIYYYGYLVFSLKCA